MKKIFVLLLAIMALAVAGSVFAATYDANITSSITVGQIRNPTFVVRALKYEPFPVNAGEWFDIWVKAENVGQMDASNSQFTLLLDYPFVEGQNLSQKFGIVSGSANAYRVMSPEENAPQINQVLLKFRVRVADNAPEGTYQLKLRTQAAENDSSGQTYSIPITIQKTKTSFDLVVQEYSSRRTTFAISNVGDKMASGVTVSVADADSGIVTGPKSQIIGTLQPGDFTTVSFQLQSTSQKTVTLNIGYTDAAGIRNVMAKEVPIDLAAKQSLPVPPSNSLISTSSFFGAYGNWIFAGVGLVIGVVIMALVGLMTKPRQR